MIIKILRGLKRILYGNTSHFTTKKSSTSLSGASWIPIYTEMLENPVKLVSVEFLKEATTPVEYRIVCNGEKIFPFVESSNMESGVCRNFLIPVEVASNEFLQIEVRGGINDKSVVIMSELAMIEIL